MKNLLILFLFCSTLNAQNSLLFDRLHGVTVNRAIYLDWDYSSKQFSYKTDNPKDEKHSINLIKTKVFNAYNQHENEISIYFGFYNPIKYALSYSNKQVDDPIYTQISKFLSSLPESIALPTTTPSGETKSTEIDYSFMFGETNEFFSNNSNIKNLKSILLYEWIYKYNSLGKKIKETESENLLKNLSKIIVLEKYLYDTISFKDKSLQFEGAIRNEIEKLKKCNSLKSFKVQLQSCRLTIEQLEKHKTNAESALNIVSSLLLEGFDDFIKPMIKKSVDINRLKSYSEITSYWLKSQTKTLMLQKENELNTFKMLVEKLGSFESKFTDDGYKLQFTSSLPYNSTKMNEISIEIQELEENEDHDKKAHGVAFTIAKYQNIIPVFSTSLIYTDFMYPNYALGTANKVELVSYTNVGLRPAAFLNGMVNMKNDWIYPIMQIGVTFGQNDVLFPLGVGFILQRKISFTGGITLGRYKALTNLKVGDLIPNDATLQNDLAFKVTAGWYFSLNYNFNN